MKPKKMIKIVSCVFAMVFVASCTTPPAEQGEQLEAKRGNQLKGIHEMWINDDGTVTLVDADDMNYLYRNGTRVGRITLSDGDVCTMGDTYHVSSSSASRTATSLYSIPSRERWRSVKIGVDPIKQYFLALCSSVGSNIRS